MFHQFTPSALFCAPWAAKKIPQVAIKDESFPGKVCIGGVEKERQNSLLLGFA